MITLISLVTICYTELLWYCWLCYICYTWHSMAYLWVELCISWSTSPISSISLSLSLWQSQFCSLNLWVYSYFASFVLFFRFHIYVRDDTVFFYVWLSSLSINSLYIHPCCCKWQDLLFNGWGIFIFLMINIWMYYTYTHTHIFSIYSPINGYLCCYCK